MQDSAISTATRSNHFPTADMPAQFDSFDLRFLYPDNWKIAARDESDGEQGTTFDLPEGGFFSIERTESDADPALIDGIVDTIAGDYEDLEREDMSLEVLPEGTPVADLRFYYLDLLIISRIVVLGDAGGCLVIQMQAESREFDKNEAVFSAILKQIVDR